MSRSLMPSGDTAECGYRSSSLLHEATHRIRRAEELLPLPLSQQGISVGVALEVMQSADEPIDLGFWSHVAVH